MTSLALALALVAGSPHGTLAEQVAIIGALADACAAEWPDEPDCLPAAVALARWESGLRWAPGRTYGLGPMQVGAGRPFRLRGRTVVTPGRRELEGPEGVRWGVLILQAKSDRVSPGKHRWRRVFEHYNGTPARASYARRVERTFVRLRAARDEWWSRATRLEEQR